MEFTRFTNAVRQTAVRYGMDLGRPLVLVSGGPDSVALLRVILDLDGEPAALHVDHGLREESREDEEFVGGLCSRLGVRCEVRRLRFEKRGNLQERARRQRYRLAKEVAGQLGLRTVATGHTADDVAETVLMNLARGTGLRGLAGIPPVRVLAELRPALRRHAVRQAYSAVLPEAPPLGSALVEAILRLAERAEGTRTLDLPGGVVVAARGGEELAFYVRAEPPEGEKDIRVGETAVFGGWRISASEVFRYEPGDAARAEVAYLDASKGPYGVRTVREGDIIRPLGLGGTKKVLRAMMDRKVPADLRRRSPVVVGGDGAVAWIPLGELGEGFKVDGKTEKILRLEVARIS